MQEIDAYCGSSLLIVDIEQEYSNLSFAKFVKDVARERQKQDRKWGVSRHPWSWWLTILGEEFGETCRAFLEVRFGDKNTLEDARRELIQVAAVAAAIVEHIDEIIAREAEIVR